MKSLKILMLTLLMMTGVTSFALSNSRSMEDGCFVTYNYYSSSGQFMGTGTVWDSSCTTDAATVNVVLKGIK